MTRVTDQYIGFVQRSQLGKVESRSVRASQIATTGMKNLQAEDDPVWAAALAQNDQEQSKLAAYTKNMDTAETQLKASDSALGSADAVLQNISELAVQMASDTMSAADRKSAVNTLQGLQDSLTAVANTKNGSTYLFAGSKITTQPFSSSGTFAGDNGSQQVQIQAGEAVTANASGAAAFTAAGGIDIFATINTLKTALASNDGPTIRGQLDTLTGAIDQVDRVRSSLGAQINQIEASRTQVGDQQAFLSNVRASSIEADSVTAYSNLAQAQQSVTSSLTVASKMFNNTLLSFLS